MRAFFSVSKHPFTLIYAGGAPCALFFSVIKHSFTLIYEVGAVKKERVLAGVTGSPSSPKTYDTKTAG
jgi:hypothetical protein